MVALGGGMHGCSGGACVVFSGGCAGSRGACVVFSWGHAWFFLGGVRRLRRDTVNERAVRILLECILVMNLVFDKGHQNFIQSI